MARRSRTVYGRRSTGSSKALLLLDFIMLILTVIAGILLLCAYAARFFNPNHFWFFAFCGLGAPILYVSNIMLFFYWVLRWKLPALIPLAVVVCGIGSVSLFFRPSLSRHYDHDQARSTTVMTYNVMGFVYNDGAEIKISSIDSIARLVARIKPDILCLQEFQAINADTRVRIDSLLGMPYGSFNYVTTNRNGGGWGLAIYSNYPIVHSNHINFEASTNSAMWCDIVKGGDTIRVFNNHLQTTAVNSSDKDYIDNHEFLVPGSEREERVRSILSKLRRNYRIRADQADSLAPLIHNSPYKVIVCGDFNDTPMSYAYNKMRGPLADAFVEKGRGMPNTYQGLFNIFRIDYIFFSREIGILNYRTLSEDFSDHKPVIAEFDL